MDNEEIELIARKLRAVGMEYPESLQQAIVIGCAEGVDAVAGARYIYAPTTSITTLANVPYKAAILFEQTL